VRERHEIERLLKRAYHGEPPVDRLMGGFTTVASALNANDQCLARIAAVHLQIPDLPSPAARDALAAEDALIKYARDESAGDANWNPALHPRGTPPNPGWFAPTDGETSSVRVAANDDPNRGSDAERPGSNTPKPYSSSPLQTKPETARPHEEAKSFRLPPRARLPALRSKSNLRLSASRAGKHCAPPPSPCCACLVRWQRISSRL
jgi:hypothetical protein